MGNSSLPIDGAKDERQEQNLWHASANNTAESNNGGFH